MTDLSYRTRTSWFSSHTLTCRLGEEHLNCSRGWRRSYAYGEIDEFRIVCFWSRWGQFSAQAFVHGAIGKTAIPSYTEESMGVSTCKAGSFLPFMEGLVERVRRANPQAKFTAGSNPLFIVNMAVASGILGFACFMASLGVGGWPLFAGFAMAIGLAFYAFRIGYRREIGAEEMLSRLRGHVGPVGGDLHAGSPSRGD